jgi:uncharacterized protein involved in exopolysaccharide biosynthesis
MEQGLAQTSLDIRGIYLMLRRHVRLLALGAGLGVVLALVLLAVNRPQYTATTALMVDSREEKILNDAIVAPFRPSSNAIASEAAVIVAPNVLKRVVDKLELSTDPDFAAHPHPPGLSAPSRRSSSCCSACARVRPIAAKA